MKLRVVNGDSYEGLIHKLMYLMYLILLEILCLTHLLINLSTNLLTYD